MTLEGSAAHCRGTKRNGDPCASTMALSADGYCLNHDPLRVEEARARISNAGRASAEAKRARRDARKGRAPAGMPSALKTSDDAVKLSSWVALALATGDIDARTGHEMCFAIMRFNESAKRRDMEAEVKALRKQLAELTKAPHLKRA